MRVTSRRRQSAVGATGRPCARKIDAPKRLRKPGLDLAEFAEGFDVAGAKQFPASPSRTGRACLGLLGGLTGVVLVVATGSPLGREALSLVSLPAASQEEREIDGFRRVLPWVRASAWIPRMQASAVGERNTFSVPAPKPATDATGPDGFAYGLPKPASRVSREKRWRINSNTKIATARADRSSTRLLFEKTDGAICPIDAFAPLFRSQSSVSGSSTLVFR